MKKLQNIWFTKNFIKYFLIKFIPLVLIMVVITLFVEKFNSDKELFTIKSEENNGISYRTKLISNQFEMISSDLIILSENSLLQDFISNNTKHNRSNIENLFLSFSNRKKIYDQIRFLDLSGKEKVRVNFNNGKPSVVAPNKLQNKGDRYYFKNSIKLSRGNVFISPFDLNVENGKIEEPLKPMIRFGIPVFDANNNKKGVVVINYLGNKILDNLKTLNSSSASETMLLNKNGYWLYCNNADNQWGFMYKEKSNRKIQFTFNEEWNKINENNTGQFQNGKGLFTYVTIYPLDEMQYLLGNKLKIEVAEQYYWKLISLYPEAKLDAKNLIITINIRAIQLVIPFIALIGAIVFARVLVLRKIAEEKREATTRELIIRDKEIKKHNKFLNTVIDSIVSPFCVININDYSIKLANSAYRSQNLQIGFFTCYSMSHRTDIPCHEDGEDCPIQTVVETKEATVVEHTHYDDANNATIHEIHGYPIFDDAGNVTEMIEYTLDITERREAEKTLKESEAQLKRMNADKDKFFAIISHDLKSPFQSIIGISEMLQDGYTELTEDEKIESLGLLNNSINGVYTLILELSEWFILQTGRMKYMPDIIDIKNLSAKVVAIASLSAKKKEIVIKEEIEENLFAFADTQMIETVVRNLFANAIKFTTNNGVITVVAKKVNKEVIIKVIDSGIGMTEEVQKKLFKIEEHHTTSGTAGEKGTGLGLVLCQELVEKNKGKIWVESKIGVGSKFIFTIPIGEN